MVYMPYTSPFYLSSQFRLLSERLVSGLGLKDSLPQPQKETAFRLIGCKDFRLAGEKLFSLLTKHLGLTPTDCILDLGCGIGRVALPLTRFIAPPGSYDGFDVSEEAIDWCRENVSQRAPHFRFKSASLYTKYYNPDGERSTLDFQLPYRDGSFDFIFVNSVFTHLPPEEVDHYLGEIRRLLKNGGRCFATFFLLNQESEGLLPAQPFPLNFEHKIGRYRLANPEVPSRAVAHDESLICDLYQKHGLSYSEPIWGLWRNRLKGVHFQDGILCSKSL